MSDLPNLVWASVRPPQLTGDERQALASMVQSQGWAVATKLIEHLKYRILSGILVAAPEQVARYQGQYSAALELPTMLVDESKPPEPQYSGPSELDLMARRPSRA